METTTTAVAMEVSRSQQQQQPAPPPSSQTGFTSFACCGSSPLNVAASTVTTTANSEAASAVVVAAAATTAAAAVVVVASDAAAAATTTPPPPQPRRNEPPSVASDPGQHLLRPASHLISKSKNLTEEDFVDPTSGGAAVSDRMTELSEGDDSWRAYYEHPLTAATTAMLNINGAGEEQNASIGLLYEYYKLPPMDKGDKLPLKYAPITEIWSSVPSTVTVVDPSSAAPIAVTSSGPVVSRASPPPLLVKEVHVNGERSLGSPHDVGVGQPAPSDVVVYVSRSSSAAPSPTDAVVVVKREPPEDPASHRSSPRDPVPEEVGEALRPPADARRNGTADGGAAADPGCCVLVSIKQEPDDSPGPAAGLGPPTGSPSTPGTPGTPIDPDPNKVRVDMAFPVQAFAMATVAYDDGGGAAPQYAVQPPPQQQFTAAATGVTAANLRQAASSYAAVTTDYYRDYVTAATGGAIATAGANGTGAAAAADYYQVVRQQLSYAGDATQENVAFVERYMRQTNNNNYKSSAGLTVDLPSPDSGIGEAAITPRDSAGLPQIFDYSDLSQNQMVTGDAVVSRTTPTNSVTGSTRRPWHDFSRSSEAEKVQIPKIFSNVGFRYFLESPISTSQRREDDRITYINKGQFYGISLEYIPDPDKPLKSQTVKSVVLLVFREEKSPEDEIKAWQFWHSRQHSVKQRILDADTKNSTGLVGCIEEVTHNAIAVYWNPLESPAKINVAVQCLSTDFSNQKGVKGLPLHLQIDTYEDVREPGPPVHRGYCQIKVFCDKGAERKTRDEERRAAKRKLTVTGRKKMDELYHPPCDRSEFYSMSDLLKPPMLFSPTEDLDKHLVLSAFRASPTSHYTLEYFDGSSGGGGGGALGTAVDKKSVNADGLLEPTPVEPVFTVPPLKKTKVAPPSDRVMLYIRQEDEEVYTPLHLVPPSLVGLANAIENKYKICASDLKHLYKRSKKGITVRMDDEMIRHYCNEDTFIISFSKLDDGYEVTLTEL